MENKTYLGDSVYGSWYQGSIRLTTENGLAFGPSNVIILEDYVYDTLVKWVEQQKQIDKDKHEQR